ncbi:undecaprenyl-diphosphate phosphatase [bacterium]|nr:undecaprenyl-diphosphate phosphatase [bacterium]
MIELFKAISMGIVQGLSEFLPISSSGHLVFTSNIIQLFSHSPIQDKNSYDIVLSMMLHIGTLIAVFIFFWKEIIEIFKAFINGCKVKKFEDYNSKMGLYIFIGTIITVAVALLLDNTAERLMESPAIVGTLLIITGIVLISSEKYSDSLKEKSTKISKRTAVIMAIAQGLAALPGFSRSGWTIAAGLFSKTDRITCAKYSFLLSIPIILGASIVYPITEVNIHELISYNWTNIIIGTIVSAIVGYLCIKYFLQFLGKYSLRVFGYYCIIVGILASLVFTFI